MKDELPFPYVVRLRSAITATIEFLRIAPQIRHRRDYDKRETDVRTELQKSLDLDLVFRAECGELSAMILCAPGVVHGFCIKTYALDQTLGPKDGGASREKMHSIREEYRVFLRTDSAHCEATAKTLAQAATAAFEGVKLPLPKGFPTTEQPKKTKP